MTLPAPWKRNTAKERRQNRAEYAALKAAWEMSAACEAWRARNRFCDVRNKVRTKIKRIAAGERVAPFTGKQIAALSPAELDRLRQVSGQRFAALSPEQRTTLRD